MSQGILRNTERYEWLRALLVYISIAASRMVFWNANSSTPSSCAFIICAFAAFCAMRIIDLEHLMSVFKNALPFLILYVCSFILNYQGMSAEQKNAGLMYLLVFMGAAIAVVGLPKESFAEWYIKIITLYSVISIPCFLIALLSPDLAKTFCQSGYDWNTTYGYSIFYTWGIHGTISSRNAGPFWEPGAFQGFINIALLLLLKNVDGGRVCRRKRTAIVLLFTLITTQSTTGYLILFLMVLAFSGEFCELFGIQNRRNMFIIGLCMVIAATVFVAGSDVVTNKIGIQNRSVSTAMRTADVIDGFILVGKAGPFGLGETVGRNQLRASLGLYKDDSAGLIQLTYTFGWFAGLAYCAMICRVPKQLLGETHRTKQIIEVVILIILHMTEGLWPLPIYWLLLFERESVELR